MKVYLAAALLLTTVLAGCSSGSDDGDGQAADAATAPVLYMNVTVDGQTYRFTSGGASGGNGTGTGSMSASATATIGSTNATATGGAKGNATGNATGAGGNATGSGSGTPSGEAPLDVKVALSASGLSGSYAWTLDWGDAAKAGAATGNGTAAGNATASASASASSTGAGAGAGVGGNASKAAAGSAKGTTLPATANHTYQSAGTYTLRFTVTPANGTASSVSTKVLVTGGDAGGNNTNGSAGAPAPGTVIGPAPPLDAEGSFLVGNPAICSEAGSFEWVVPASDNATGAALAVTGITVTLEGDDTNVDSDLELYGPDGELIDDAVTASSSETITADGPIPAGTFVIVVLACAGVAAGFTVHAEGTLVAA